MKKNVLLLLVLMLLPMVASADPVEINGIYYNLNFQSKIAEVTFRSSGLYTGIVEIPNSISFKGTEYGVTSIGGEAFYGCTGLTSVTIPNSVTSIGSRAFYDCTGLTSITIPNSVTSIGYEAFSGCTGLTSIAIPNSVTSIGGGAFGACTGFTSVHITDLEAWCSILFDGDLANPLHYAHHLFLNGEEFKDLVIPNSVTSIGEYAFSGCTGLTSIAIPNSVTSIGECAFQNCSGLTSVTIPSSVTSIGEGAFRACSGLTSVSIPNSVTSINSKVFSGCSNLITVSLGNSVETIEYAAFGYCSGLTSITIPNSVTSIGEYAFRGCIGLTSIVVDEGNTRFDSRENCNAIIETSTNTMIVGCKNTIIPNSVTSIGEYAFDGCTGLTSIAIPNSVTTIGLGAFGACTGLTSVSIPNSVTSINSKVFSGCSNLITVSLGNSVETIEYAAFGYCSGLTSITIPNSVTSIGEYAFDGCSGLTSVTIPNSVTSIGEYAFSGCSGLTSVTIGSGVQTIGPSAFAICQELADVYCYAEAIPTTTDGTAFDGSLIDYATLYVPEASLGSYSATSPWNGFGEIKKIPSSASSNVGLTGWATFCSPLSLDFTGTEIDAYIITGVENDGTTISKAQVYKVPAGTGLLLHGTTDDIPVYTGNNLDDVSANKLIGVVAGSRIVEAGGSSTVNYVMVANGTEAEFQYVGSTSATVNAGKAYLSLPIGVNSAPQLIIGGDGDVTNIGATLNDNGDLINGSDIYDLQGRQAVQPTKGIYIMNGKKVIIK